MTDINIDMLARTCYGEARGEGTLGMKAVACVVMNRVALAKVHPRFGDGTPYGACMYPWQFSCHNPNDPNCQIINDVDDSDPIFVQALQIATSAVNGLLDDITGGATYYKVRGTEADWANGHDPCCLIGKHEFYKNIP